MYSPKDVQLLTRQTFREDSPIHHIARDSWEAPRPEPAPVDNFKSIRKQARIFWQTLTCDHVNLLIIGLSLLLMGTILGLALWANKKGEGLCATNIRVIEFYNQLVPSILTVLPGIGVLIFFMPMMPPPADHGPGAKDPRIDPNRLYIAVPGWTRKRIVLIGILVACLTVFIAPWTQYVELKTWRIECGLVGSRWPDVQGVVVGEHNARPFCEDVMRLVGNGTAETVDLRAMIWHWKWSQTYGSMQDRSQW